MSPTHHASSLLSRWALAGCAVLIALGWPLGARAYTFNLVGNGSGQRLNTFWEGCFFSCVTTGTCGNFTAANGRVPYTAGGTGGNLYGGLLDWTASSGSLSVVAMPAVSATVGGGVNNCAGQWAAVDAREIPLVFAITPQVGDPFPLDVTLHIQPRLLGSVDQATTVDQSSGNGTQANLWLQMTATVHVDDQLVSADSINMFQPLSNGATSHLQLSFPKGAANSVVVPGLTSGSEVTVRIWAYMRGYVSNPYPGSAYIYATSDYGQGPAIEILIRDQNAVDVPPAPDPSTLSLAARPNPSPGETRISYALPRPAPVRLSIYDLSGARVATLVDRADEAGAHEITWNGRGRSGERLAAGVYVLELMAGSERRVGKVALLGR